MSTSQLFSPFELGQLTLANRVVMAPLTRGRAGKARIPNKLMAEYYAQRSSAGLIISEATTISEQANGWNESPGIYTDEMTKAWKTITTAVHKNGGRIFLQLWHMGRASHSSFHNGELPVAPSAIKIEGDGLYTPNGKQDYEVPRALETSEIPGIVEDYRRAAERAREAGFDGVEIHGANGYLIDQFLQSKTNQRTDRYGGSVENRYRLLGEVVHAVTGVWPADQVGVRLSPNGVFNDMGSNDYREQFTYAAQQLDRYSLAYLHVLDGLAFGFHELGNPMTLSEFRRVFHGALIGNCGYSREEAEERLQSGEADLIAFGRPFISNPDLVERFQNDWPLAEAADMSVWYSPTGAAGYTDFPTYHETVAT
ncbi:alkene reductase [Rubinisphaera margarita]|uniref:alkene reductase n=1 Tax=Rubinisphaera margarita TaxID=2909586 RepID=UPI001EE8F2AB|nr:alkene reductase [Rubinisphaera margarita]MCG6156440.1 alkene reductase [Rubinisphaera margarita]